jgi:hypothetical protein
VTNLRTELDHLAIVVEQEAAASETAVQAGCEKNA